MTKAEVNKELDGCISTLAVVRDKSTTKEMHEAMVEVVRIRLAVLLFNLEETGLEL